MLAPAEIAEKSIEIGQSKAKLPWWKMILLGMFAGMFIALAGVGATFANIYGGKLAGACVFTAGLAMVVVAGSELFTGNNLMIVALFRGKIKFHQLLKNWIFVFIGNLIGAILVAGAVSVSGLFNPVSDTVIATATAKVDLGFFEAIIRGVLCNFLVCIAVWMSFSANTVTGKIAAVFLPVMLFVLCGFEHSVANMFYVPSGIIMGWINNVDAPTIQAFLLHNLLPVTIGNIIGGAFLVGGGYFLAYCTKKSKKH